MIAAQRITYPDSDGRPSAENTRHFDWIALFKWNLEALFDDRSQVFVAADIFIYPVEGDNAIRTAPDVYVAIDRPKGPRGSYRVWEEANIFPQVIFEVAAPTITPEEMEYKFDFYSRFGAEEYYVLQPEGDMSVRAWLRTGSALESVDSASLNDFVSPRLGFRLVKRGREVRVHGPNGRRWGTPSEMVTWAKEAERRAERRDKLRELGLDPDSIG